MGRLLLLLALASPALAALEFGEERDAVSSRLRSSFRSWRVNDQESGQSVKIEQFSSRLLSTVDATDDLRFVLYYSGGVSQAGEDQQDQLSGGADLKVKAFYHLADRRVLASIGANLPTGRTALSDEEVRVAGAISSTVLGFPMRRYGEGFDLDLGVTVGQAIGRKLALAAGASLLLKGAYDVDPITEYGAGEELAIAVGADWLEKRWFVRADAVLRTFGTDEVNGRAAFDEGDQLELTLRAGWRSGPFGVAARLRDIVKGSNDVIVSETPGTDQRVDNGNTLWLSVTPSLRAARMLELRALCELVSANRSHQQETAAWALGLGGAAELLLTPRSMLEVRAQYLVGESENETIDLRGWDTAVGLGFQY